MPALKKRSTAANAKTASEVEQTMIDRLTPIATINKPTVNQSDAKQAVTEPPTVFDGGNENGADGKNDGDDNDAGNNEDRKTPARKAVRRQTTRIDSEMREPMDQTEAETRAIVRKASGFRIAGPYYGKTIEIAIGCPSGCVRFIRPESILENGCTCKCKRCIGGQPKKRSAEQVRTAFREDFAERFPRAAILGPIKTGIVAVKCKCARGHDCIPRPNNVLNGSGICRRCADDDIKETNRRWYEIQRRNRLKSKGLTMDSNYAGWNQRLLMHCNVEAHPPFTLCMTTINIGPSCPICAGRYKGQTRCGRILRKLYGNVETDVVLPGQSDRRYDFRIRNRIGEYDGEHHFKAIEYFGGDASFKQYRNYDLQKTRFALDNKQTVVRIDYRWLKMNGAEQVAFLREAFASSEKLLVSDAKLYDWLNTKGMTPVEHRIVAITDADRAIANEMATIDANGEGYDSDYDGNDDTDCKTATPTQVHCPAHGGGCFVDVDEVEHIRCKYGCILHVGLVFKTTSIHPDADKQRQRLLERRDRCRNSHTKIAESAPPRQPKSSKSAPCPIHENCRVPTKRLLFRTCPAGHPECGSLELKSDKPKWNHPQSEDYNARQQRWRRRCVVNPNIITVAKSDDSKKRIASEPTVKKSKRSVLDVDDDNDANADDVDIDADDDGDDERKRPVNEIAVQKPATKNTIPSTKAMVFKPAQKYRNSKPLVKSFKSTSPTENDKPNQQTIIAAFKAAANKLAATKTTTTKTTTMRITTTTTTTTTVVEQSNAATNEKSKQPATDIAVEPDQSNTKRKAGNCAVEPEPKRKATSDATAARPPPPAVELTPWQIHMAEIEKDMEDLRRSMLDCRSKYGKF